MLLSDWLWFFHKTIIALSGGHFEYFLSFPKKITLVYGLGAPQKGGHGGPPLQIYKSIFIVVGDPLGS
jgi:hypothetical protein